MNKSKNLDRGGYAGCTDWEPLKKAYSKKTKPKTKKKRKLNVRLRKNSR